MDLLRAGSMDDKQFELGPWKVKIEPDEPSTTTVSEVGGRTVETLLGDSLDEKYRLALLIMKAPTMRDALLACRTIFRVMAKEGDAKTAGAAQEVLPPLDSALWNLVEDPEAPSL
jgi:hypothetical protein